jgi:hypothetical protein
MAYTQNDYQMGGYGETEEERRRRLEQEAADAAAAAEAAKPSPVKETRTIDPVTGEVRLKIEGNERDLSAANPLTPTVVAPVAPEVLPEPVVQSAPVTPTAPATVPALNQAEQQRSVADGLRAMMSGPSVQVAGPAQMPPAVTAPAPAAAPAPVTMAPAAVPQTFAQDVAARKAAQPMLGAQPMAAPVVPVAPTAAVTPTGASMVAAPAPAPSLAQAGAQAMARGASSEGTAGESQAQSTIQVAQDRFLQIQDNTDELMKYAADATVPKYLQDRARETAYEQLVVGRQEQKARDTAQKIIAEGDGKKIANALQGRGARGDEGSYLKMIMLGFISPELAGAEAVKLGLKASKWETSLLTDDKGNTTAVEIQRRADGKLIGGTRVDGTPLTTKELEKAAGSTGQKLGIVGGTYVNDRTGEVGRVISDEKTGISYVQTDTGRKPMTGFRPQATAGTLGDMNTRQLQELRNKLDFAGPNASVEAREKIIAESEAKFGLLGEEYKAQIRGAAPRPAAGVTAPAPAAAAPAPAAAAPAVATTRVPATPVAPTPVVATGRPTTGVGGGGGATPGQREANLATQQAAAAAEIQRKKEMQLALEKPAAAAAGADAATTVKNQAFADRTYDLIKPINDAIVKSTGSSIGAGVDTVAAAIGKSTEGSKAIARLNVLSYGILANIPRFEGPQSDIDVQMYKQAAGDFNNRKLPIEDRLAALDALNSILKRYDRAGKNDWTFGAGAAGGTTSGTTSSGNKFKKVP